MHTSYNLHDRSNVDVWVKSYEVCKYTIYSLLRKTTEYIMLQKILHTMFCTLLEYDLGDFVYDSIWLEMMYSIENWGLKWFVCIVSQPNIQGT